MNERQVWEHLNKQKINSHTNVQWLIEAYSPEFSIELRIAIVERICVISKEGWANVHFLYHRFGFQPELIHAAGMCHQHGARDWLLKQLNEQEEFQLKILQALACWGAYLPQALIQKTLSQPEQAMQLAGLELLTYKAHQLSDTDLLEMTDKLLDDFREAIVIATIKILQRRDGIDICKAIANVIKKGTDASAYAAIMALGSIGSVESTLMLSNLRNQLPAGERLNLVDKQLQHQYLTSKTC